MKRRKIKKAELIGVLGGIIFAVILLFSVYSYMSMKTQEEEHVPNKREYLKYADPRVQRMFSQDTLRKDKQDDPPDSFSRIDSQ